MQISITQEWNGGKPFRNFNKQKCRDGICLRSGRKSAEWAISGTFLLRYQIVEPYALFHQNEADHALDELNALA